MTKPAALCLCVVFICALGGACSAGVRLAPPPEGVYHSAHPDFGARDDEASSEMIKAFEEMSGKKIVWAYVSWHWDRGIKFPVSACEAIRAAGAEPLVGVMPWSSLNQGYPEPEYTLERIARGAFDDELYHAADIVRSLGYPIMMEFGPEVNGSWFPWNGAWNGRDADEYGEPGEPDGPERFRDAYRHIADIFRMGGGDVTWVFHVSSAGSPSDEWNAVSRYYPGDGWVDWIGVSVYGRLKGGGLRSFGDIMEGAYPGLCALSPSKPIAVLEMGVSEGPGKAEWIKDAFAGVNSGRYPRVRAVSWWNKASRPDGSRSGLEIDSSPESLAAYREGVGNLIDEAVWIDD